MPQLALRTPGWRWRAAMLTLLVAAAVFAIAIVSGVIPLAHAADGSGFGPGTAAVLPGDATANPAALVVGVSCSAPGDCGAIGFYGNGAGQQGLLLTETDGVWAPAVKLTLPSTASSSPSVLLTSISCPSEGDCLAAGSYSDTVNGLTTVVVTESGGVWGSGAELTPPAGAPANTSVQISAVSCTSADTCTAVGEYGSGEGIMATETDGTWGPERGNGSARRYG